MCARTPALSTKEASASSRPRVLLLVRSDTVARVGWDDRSATEAVVWLIGLRRPRPSLRACDQTPHRTWRFRSSACRRGFRHSRRSPRVTGCHLCAFGRDGDGDLHATVLVDPHNEEELDAAEAVSAE